MQMQNDVHIKIFFGAMRHASGWDSANDRAQKAQMCMVPVVFAPHLLVVWPSGLGILLRISC